MVIVLGYHTFLWRLPNTSYFLSLVIVIIIILNRAFIERFQWLRVPNNLIFFFKEVHSYPERKKISGIIIHYYIIYLFNLKHTFANSHIHIPNDTHIQTHGHACTHTHTQDCVCTHSILCCLCCLCSCFRFCFVDKLVITTQLFCV